MAIESIPLYRMCQCIACEQNIKAEFTDTLPQIESADLINNDQLLQPLIDCPDYKTHKTPPIGDFSANDFHHQTTALWRLWVAADHLDKIFIPTERVEVNDNLV